MGRGRKKQRGRTRHHIVPRSRGGGSKLENIAYVPKDRHQKYHDLFINRTPDEIVETLVNDYWNGQWDYVLRAYERNNGKP